MERHRFNAVPVILLLGLLLFSDAGSPVLAQDYSSLGAVYPPSPEAIAMARTDFSEVDLYRGRSNYSIPLYTIHAGAFSFPISLQYIGGNGIKVSEVASSAGLGWSLQHTGMVTRTVHGRADDEDNGYVHLDPFPNIYDINNWSLYTQLYGTNKYDSQPDTYHLSLGDQSASFYIGKDQKVIFIEQSELRIVPFFSPTLSYFQVTDPSGLVYVLGERETIHTTNYDQPNMDPTYIAHTWYLQTVTSPQGVLLAEFEYDLSPAETLQHMVRPFRYADGNEGPFDEGALTEALLRIRRPVLQRIVFDTGAVTFSYTPYSRQDLSGDHQVDSVVVRDAAGQPLRRFKFDHSYFTSTGTMADPGTAGPIYGNSTVRLKLDRLTEIPQTGPSRSWEFEYQSGVYLPPRIASFSQDHWGYYNGKTTNTGSEARRRVRYYRHTGSIFVLDTVYTEMGTADREPALPYALAGMLRRVRLPTGGELRFDYELHSTDDARLPGPLIPTFKGFEPFPTPPVYFTVSLSGSPASKVTVSSPVAPQYMIEYFVYDSLMTESFHHDTLKWDSSFHDFLLGPGRYRLVSSLIGSHPDPGWYYGSMLQWENEQVSMDKAVGGLRIAKIEEWDPHRGTSGEVVRTRRYYYNQSGTASGTQSTGEIPDIPNYGYQRIGVFSSSYVPDYFSQEYLVPTGYERQLHAQYPLEVAGGYHVGYRKVTVEVSDSLRSEYHYTTSRDFKETQFGYAVFYNDTYTAPIGGQRYEVLPVAPFDHRDYLRGRLVRFIDYRWDGSGYQPVRQVENTYAFNMGALLGNGPGEIYEVKLPDTMQYIPGIIFERRDDAVFFKQYHLYSGRYDLKEQRETEYMGSDSISRHTVWTYGDSPWFRDSAFHFQPTRVSLTTSKGGTRHDDLYYPYNWRNPPAGEWDSGQIALLKILDQHNRISTPVLTRRFLGSSHLSTTKEVYASFPGLASPMVATVRYRQGASSVYTDRQYFQSYNPQGRLLEYRDYGGPPQSFLWSYGGQYRTAEVHNATQDQIAFADFESDGKGNWNYSGTPVSDATAPTGRRAYNLSGGLSKTGLNAATTYLLTYWANSSAAGNISGGTATPVRTHGSWTMYRRVLTGVTGITFSGSVRVDDVRLHPLGAMMVTYTYDPLVGMTSETDAAGRTRYYQYDGYQRLRAVRDQDGRLIEEYIHHYVNP